MFLVDTNVWLELLLGQKRAAEVRRFFRSTDAGALFVSGFSLYSIGIILFRLGKSGIFEDFLSDVIENSSVRRVTLETADFRKVSKTARKNRLDFDDAYQYVAAEKLDLTIISFDEDFDRTERGRKSPADFL